MVATTYHAPYNQHTIATRNQGDIVSSMLPILGSGDGSCSALGRVLPLSFPTCGVWQPVEIGPRRQQGHGQGSEEE